SNTDDLEKSLSSNKDSGSNEEYRREILSGINDYDQDKTFNCFYSPEIIKNKTNLGLSKGDKIRYIGFVRNHNSRSSRELYDSAGILITGKESYFADNTWSVTETLEGDNLIMNLAFPW